MTSKIVANLSKVIIDVIGHFFKVGTDPIKASILELYNFLFTRMNDSIVGLFDNPIVKAFLYLANMASWLVLGYSLIFYFLSIVQEKDRNWYVIFKCFVTTVFFILFNQILARLVFFLPSYVASTLDTFISGDATSSNVGKLIGSELNSIAETIFSKNMALSIILFIALVAFFVVSIMRVGAIFIQIMSAPSYVQYFLLGKDQQGFEWINSTIAIGLTYIIQYCCFYSGICILAYSKNIITSYVLGGAFILATFAVPKQLQKRSWISGAGQAFQSAYMGGNMMLSLLRNKV
ncbi:hypothetical protein EDD70_0510 [Hydrogenoanaerobacterium saccharovorans]|uniref:TrbL/VirB6 plasmid conjugal transfer protein n=1 Tax=Hydrogenoanaerobacterium saccharovorans TaxID=474960 RepID=A0A1H8AW88_9FIRM|nr:hypothetical protein [Hydrogenoanaerobacterium saccharovorans]RPF47711.1 hypothetical protein EDD70_0510 [Hydrogenoanaerobacterium saccharovorans]SEM74980.1 hypothetical protein SAMN05216180_1581 [Hydrogenoanaerobacterium saccharovorans]